MANVVEEFLYLQEVSRWINSISKKSGKPEHEVERVWRETEKEVVSPLHKGGITDHLSQVSKIVKNKTGVKPDEGDEKEDDVENKD